VGSIVRRAADSLRVLTLNLWARRGDWSGRRKVLADALRDLEPDFVAFQESTLVEGYDQAADILPPGYQLVHSVARGSDGVGSAVASRLPITSSRELDLQVTSRTRGFPAMALVVELAHERFGRLILANHLPNWQLSFERERELQTVLLARVLESMVGEDPDDAGNVHVIVAGDLDAEPEAASVRFWRGLQSLDGLSVSYRSAWESVHPDQPRAETFTPANPLHADWDWPYRAIDHILVRCGLHGGPTLAVRRCELFLDQPVDGVWASDHFGLVADLGLPPGRTTRR
jgi:endonuclease/exonuclease/phosphatase family metal-dependent hydrolase